LRRASIAQPHEVREARQRVQACVSKTACAYYTAFPRICQGLCIDWRQRGKLSVFPERGKGV